MSWKKLAAALACSVALLAGHALVMAAPAETYPLKQGLHQWTAGTGKLMLVAGTYQDTTTFRRAYSFYFKEANDDAWNQVPVPDKNKLPQFTWNSAVGGETTLADGIVAARQDGIYFVVADKRVERNKSYVDKGDIFVTWYKFTQAGDDHPDDPPYAFKPAFTRTYPKTADTVDAILAREASLQPRK
ncbi:hypothetical protein [Massilia sp. TN1-12]|uniref:hypothetical protein n=1 Tax=Massilia paldalensis TaxID=3377675 RepID=UPI00384B57A2